MKSTQIAARVLAASLLASAIFIGVRWFLRPAEAPTLEQFGGAASIARDLLVIAVGAGIAAMATVQFWKVVFRPRAAFHRAQLELEFPNYLEQVLGLRAPESPNSKSESAGGPELDGPELDDLLDNPVEVVMGQIRSAADYILLRPKGFELTLYMLAGDAGKEAVAHYVATRGDPEKSEDALVAVRFFVEQRLNLLHVALKERWRRQVRLIAVVVAGSAGLLIISLSTLGPIAKLVAIGAAAMWGGFFAWFARDVVALIERRRT